MPYLTARVRYDSCHGEWKMAENRNHSVKLGIVNHMQPGLELMALEEVLGHSVVGMMTSEEVGSKGVVAAERAVFSFPTPRGA